MSALAPQLAAAHAGGRPDTRGNAYDRARRKRWLLSPEAGHGGTGISVPCRWCGRRLVASTVEADRWPICGHAGGSYRRGNIVPACRDCNAGRCSGAAPCGGVVPGQTLELFGWRPARTLPLLGASPRRQKEEESRSERRAARRQEQLEVPHAG